MLAFLRRLSATRLGALLGSLVVMAGGVAASRIQYTPILLVYCFIPFALLAIRNFVRGPSLINGLLMDLAAGCMLVQPVQLTYLSGGVLFVYACVSVIRSMRFWQARQRMAHGEAGSPKARCVAIGAVIQGAVSCLSHRGDKARK